MSVCICIAICTYTKDLEQRYERRTKCSKPRGGWTRVTDHMTLLCQECQSELNVAMCSGRRCCFYGRSNWALQWDRYLYHWLWNNTALYCCGTTRTPQEQQFHHYMECWQVLLRGAQDLQKPSAFLPYHIRYLLRTLGCWDSILVTVAIIPEDDAVALRLWRGRLGTGSLNMCLPT